MLMRLCSYLIYFSRLMKQQKAATVNEMDLNTTNTAATIDSLEASHDYMGLAIVFVSVWGQFPFMVASRCFLANGILFRWPSLAFLMAGVQVWI